VACPLRRAELPQRLGFDLADAFAGNIELLPDLFQGMLALTADTKTQSDDFLFLRRESLQYVRRFILDVRVNNSVNGRSDPLVFNQVAKGGLAIAANRSLERDWVARDGLQLLDLLPQ